MKTNGRAQVWFICTVHVLLVLLSYTFTSCFPSNTVVNYWCYHHAPHPSLHPSPSYSHPRPLQGSPSLTESPKNRPHTIPVTISNKAEQGEGQDAPWHLKQWLSYNNSIIFNPKVSECTFYYSTTEKLWFRGPAILSRKTQLLLFPAMEWKSTTEK